MNRKIIWAKILLAGSFLLTAALSIKQLREPDLWWQIRTGEWIIANGKVPTQDVFSFTYSGTPWINIKWGFEVLAAFIAGWFGAECVLLLQLFFSVLLLYTLWQTSKLFAQQSDWSDVVFPIAAMFLLPAIDYRMVGRPEMITHFFTALFLFLLLRYHRVGGRQIYILIPLQLLWANMHEAFGVGVVLVSLFTAAYWSTYAYQKYKQKSVAVELPTHLTLVLLASLGAVCINPQGIKLLLQPIEIFGQVHENKFTTELLDFTNEDFWQWQTYLTYGMLLFSLSSLVWQQKKKKLFDTIIAFHQQMPLGYWITVIAFMYLSTTAYRNLVFLPIVSFPLFFIAIQFWLSKIKKTTTFSLLRYALVGLYLLCYVAIVSNKYYELSGSRDRYGWSVPSIYNPVGAADFIQQNNLRGACFSDYLTSSYLLWRLQPEFKTFIDLRDLDIFPSSFFNQFAEAVTIPSSFEQLDSAYKFRYVVLYRPQFPQLHFYLFNESNFRLAYADAVACVYIRTADSTQPREFTFSSTPKNTQGKTAKLVTKLFNPLANTATSLTSGNFEAAAFANVVGQPNSAELYARKAIAEDTEKYRGQQLLGEVYYNKALRAATAEEKLNWILQAQSHYQQSLLAKPDYAVAHLGLGAVYFQQENYRLALSAFDEAIKYDDQNLNAHLFAAECAKFFINQKGMNNIDEVKLGIKYYEKANRLNPNNPTIMMNLGVLYFKINDCANTKKYLAPISSFDGFQPAEQKNIATCLSQCGYTK